MRFFWQSLSVLHPSIRDPILKTYVPHMPSDAYLHSDLSQRGFRIAHILHQDQTRRDNSPFLEHVTRVARMVYIYLPDDEDAITAALLHDALETRRIDASSLRAITNDNVCRLVQGCTAITSLPKSHSCDDTKRLVQMFQNDTRVGIIKVAERVHNMRSVRYETRCEQRRLSHQAMVVYVPFADQTGMLRLRNRLADMSLATLHSRGMLQTRRERSRCVLTRLELNAFHEYIHDMVNRCNVDARVIFRPKSVHSTYAKMRQLRVLHVRDVYDVNAFRIIVHHVKTCYRLMRRMTHFVFSVKDYIAFPKSNGYQALHLLVYFKGKTIELQFRTVEMHAMAEWGGAAHWEYKMSCAAQVAPIQLSVLIVTTNTDCMTLMSQKNIPVIDSTVKRVGANLYYTSFDLFAQTASELRALYRAIRNEHNFVAMRYWMLP